uniref:Periplakin n=1 Tax=Esox lucius TaxID=8010 RepID=A0A6Q2YMP2_ESOLU
MFKKKSSKTITQPKKATAVELSDLVEKLQKNADKVEKQIYETELNLNKDVTKINEGKQPLYQDDTNKRILNALELLQVLDEDTVNVVRLQHPQAEMIEQDMKQLRNRVKKLKDDHSRIYHLTRSEGLPSVNWGNIIDEKQGSLNNKAFGEDLPTVERELEAHNIFHSEVEALGLHISEGGDKDYVSGIQLKYSKLLAASSARQRHLLTLRDYMQRCTNELYWMDQQAEERMSYDWSDTNLDFPARQRQYENFISKSLESKEASVTQLNEDGEKLIAAGHPGKNVIEAHMDAVHADWKEYLNLLICEENHLKHMDEYHKFHKDARDTQDLLKRLDMEVTQKYKPDYKDMYQTESLIRDLDDQVKAMDHFDERVKVLEKRSLQVLPLKFRRETPQKLLPVEALCEFDTEEGQIQRGERYTLLSKKGNKWDVKDSVGHKITAPGICFMFPPTDPESVAVATNLAAQQKGIKSKVTGSRTVLVKRLDELKKDSSLEEQQCRQLMAGLDKVTSDLDKQQKAIYTRVRPPLENTRPLQDSADRLQDIKDIATVVRKIEPEKSSKVKEAESFLKSNPKCASAPQLNGKVNEEIASELKANRSVVTETEANLRAAKGSCDTMATKLQEHCSDIDRQEGEVLKLNKRYDNLNRQIDIRSQSLQRAKISYNNYRSDYDTLNSWLSRVPNYEPTEKDNLSQVETKLENQKSYENETEKFKALLELEDGLVPQTYKRSRLESPALRVKDEESAIEAKFTEVNAVNKQRLANLQFAQNLMNQQSEMIVCNNVQQVKSAAPGEEAWRIKSQLKDEIQRREQLEKDLEKIQSDIYVLEGQKPEDTIVKKETIKKVPDPTLVEEVHNLRQKLSDETRSSRALENDLEALRLKLRGIETEVKEGAQQYTVKEVLRIEKDRGQVEEVRRLREELEELRRQKMIKDNEVIQIQKHVTLLSEQKSKEQEVITEEEVIKVQNDPQLENEYRVLLDRKQKEQESRKQLEDELRFLQDKLRRLEKEKSMAEEKISIKEVLKVEKDIAFEREVENLKRQLEDEKANRRSYQRERTDLERKISSLEEEKSRVMVQEKVREIVRPDPKAEAEVANLRMELVEHQRRYRDADQQLKSLQDELKMLRNRGPQIEVKEIIKEVIKYKTDPQTERELEKLRNEIVDKTHQTEKSEMEIRQLREEIQRWKDTKPQVQVKEVVNEVLEYRENPKTKEEIETLKRKLADEQKKRLDLEKERLANEEKIRLRKIDLSQVREKVVQQEVIKLEEDPLLKSECNTFVQSINNEQKQRETLKEELYRLQKQKADLDEQLEELERERRARRDAELEIQRLRVRLNELEIRDKENRERVTVKQKVVLQQDPQQEKEHSVLKLQVEEERHKRTLLEKELNILLEKQITLEKMEVKEKVVRTETIQVEKDPEAELEIETMKRTLDQEKQRRRELDQDLNTLKSRLSEMEFTNSKSSKELDYIRAESNRLQQENQRLQNDIRRLQSEITITSTETQSITKSAPMENGKNLELRLDLLQKELAELKAVTRQKDEEIEKLQKSISAIRVKKEQRESHLRRSIVVIDPDSGKEMRPEEAYKQGLIDWKMFVNLQSQECDWEEITVKGPKGESSVLHDRKSGKKFSIEDALKAGNITNRQLQQYHNKEITIQEFGVMVSGQTK